MKLFDWLNDNPWLILITIILTACLRCSTTPQADTIRLQERSENTIEKLDTIKCDTQECKDALTQAKQFILDSMDTLVEKDSTIQSKEKQIQNQTIYTNTGKFVIWGGVIIAILSILYFFRTQILDIVKAVKPL